jgi:hypothetical protein
MTLRTFLILLVGCSLAGIVYAATGPANHDADAINRWFDDLLLIVSRARGLIEPIVGLAVAVMLAMQYLSLRRQKETTATVKEVHVAQVAATAERKEQASTLAAQNDVLADVKQTVETVKAAVAPSEPITEQPKDYPT